MKEKFLNKKREILLSVGVVSCFLFMGVFFPRAYVNHTENTTLTNQYALGRETSSELSLRNKEEANVSTTADTRKADFIYLSDIDYIASQSRSGWGSLLKDTTSAGTKIAVKIENAFYEFDKGMWAHATSVLVYDIHAYDYEYFTAYLGLNRTAAYSSNGVKYYIYTSVDGKQWDLQTEENPIVTLPGANASFVKIPIKNANYLKLVADSNGGNGNDHAVYADAKLTNEVEENNIVPSVSQYDELIQRKYSNTDLTNPEYELVLLQRNLVKNMGQYAISRFVSESNENKEAFEWLFNNLENLRLYTLGGVPEGGSYYNSLNVLKSILKKHKSDFDITEVTKYGTRYGDLYKKMAIALSLTHSKLVGLWMQASQPENVSDAVTRYEIYKMLHKNNKFVVTPNIDITKWFENYTIEEMRFVMNNNIDDEEILWLNEYTQSFVDQYPNQAWKYLTPHPYMAYVWPNYGNPVFHDPERKEYWDEKFKGIFSKYGVTYRTGLYKVWMNFRNEFGTGAVCGGISKTGSNIRGSHGIPSAVIGQPGHAAIIYYTQDANGNGYWNIDNDVSGWTLSEKGERMLLGWGNASFSRGYSVVYMALSQEVLNDYDTFEASEKLVYLADVYHNDLVKQEQIYRKALQIQPLNIDAWYGLITNFNANSNKTEADYYALAKEIGDSLKYFPLPMQHLTNLIQPKITSAEYGFKFTLLQTRILTEGGQTPNNTAENYYVYQPSLTRLEANYLLGKLDKEVASFSFDGVHANKIKLASRFDANGVRWEYSLDGQQTWKEVFSLAGEEHSVTLTPEEIASITADNDIYINIVGAPRTPENVYKIDITTSTLPTNLYANDLENRVIGVNTGFEWRNSDSDAWTSYATSSPDNTGNKTLQVRVAATGTVLPSEIFEATFTEDNQPDTQKYIRVSHLSIQEYSTQSVDNKRPFYAENVIDGNLNTLWNTDFRYSVLQQETKPFITIKLDEPTYLSALEFVQKKYRPDNPDAIKTAIVYVSQDGKDFTEAGRIENIENYEGIKKILFAESIYGQYVKLEMETYNIFASLAMVNLFEDTTKQEVIVPTAGIAYDKTTLTNGNVLARLVNPSTNITITSDGGDTHIFSKNGEFVFVFKDENDVYGSVTAKVDWIDKDAPTAAISYSTKNSTNKDVDATLIDISEDVYLLDKDDVKVNFIEVENKIVKRIQYLDNNGEITKILYLNDSLNTEKIDYYYLNDAHETNIYTVYLNLLGNVVKEEFKDLDGTDVSPTNREEIRSLHTIARTKPLTYTFEQNCNYTFKLEDKAGNRNDIVANVNWVDKEAPIAYLSYSKMEETYEPVIASLVASNEEITIINNNGNNSYIFTTNGSFEFIYQDKAGNISRTTAVVNWIKDRPIEDNKPGDDIEDNKDNNDNNNPNDSSNNQNLNQGNNSSTNNTTSSINEGSSTNIKTPTVGNTYNEGTHSTFTDENSVKDNTIENELNNDIEEEKEETNENSNVSKNEIKEVPIEEKNQKNKNKIVGFIGLISFIIAVSLIRFLIQRKKERR